jgi:hypothetical protein
MMILATSREPIRIPVDGPSGTDLTQFSVSVAIVPDTGAEPALADYVPATPTGCELELMSDPTMWPVGDYMAYVRLSAPPADVRLQAGRIRIGDPSISSGNGGSGMVSSVAVETANGFAGTVTDPTGAAQVTIKVTVSGLLKADGTSVAEAEAGVDYLTPDGDGSELTGLTADQLSGLGTAAGHDAADFDEAGSAEAVSGALASEVTRATTAEGVLSTAISSEVTRAEDAEAGKVTKAGDTLTGGLAPKTVTLAYTATVTPDARAGNVLILVMTGDCTVNPPADGVLGQLVRLWLTSAGHAVTWGTGWNWGTAGEPSLSGSGSDTIVAEYDGVNWRAALGALGF